MELHKRAHRVWQSNSRTAPPPVQPRHISLLRNLRVGLMLVGAVVVDACCCCRCSGCCGGGCCCWTGGGGGGENGGGGIGADGFASAKGSPENHLLKHTYTYLLAHLYIILYLH